MTNFEKIKSMGIEELAKELQGYTSCDFCPIGEFCYGHPELSCVDKVKIWLESEVDENEYARIKESS